MNTFLFHHNQIIDKRADAGASSTSICPLPSNWLAAHIADLTPDLQVLFLLLIRAWIYKMLVSIANREDWSDCFFWPVYLGLLGRQLVYEILFLLIGNYNIDPIFCCLFFIKYF